MSNEKANHGFLDEAVPADDSSTRDVPKVTRGTIEKERALPPSFVGVLGSLPEDAIRYLEIERMDISRKR
jgi:hypothetical protein